MEKPNNYSDYIIYADESGDHYLGNTDENYPIFCLALCIINKEEYINNIVPKIQKLKFDFWGHDKIVLHEREIRKQENDFAFLRTNKKLRQHFLERVNEIIEGSSFWIVSSVIQKDKLSIKYANPFNPYYIALQICMEKLLSILIKENQANKQVYCIFENRGPKEDEQLELEFYRIINNQNDWGYQKKDFKEIDFMLKFAGKEHNSTGLQLADLIARPIGLKTLRPQQGNRAYDILEKKYNNGYVNKVFPL